MQRDAYGNYITPGTGWGEIARVATQGAPVLQTAPITLQAPNTGTGDQRLGTLSGPTTTATSGTVSYRAPTGGSTLGSTTYRAPAPPPHL